jgi:RHS repeat-associated protein
MLATRETVNDASASASAWPDDLVGAAVMADAPCLAACEWAAGPEQAHQYYRARYYDGRAGRFMREDPIGFAGGDANLYRYVRNSPTNSTDASGEVSMGVGGSASAEGGLVLGAGATGSVGYGVFVNGWKPSLGGFVSGGAFGGAPGTGNDSAAPSRPGDNNWAIGGYAGAGGNVWVSNASVVSQLAGPFRTFSANLGFGLRGAGLQFSWGRDSQGKLIMIVSYGGPPIPFPTGIGGGASISMYNTFTKTSGDVKGN